MVVGGWWMVVGGLNLAETKASREQALSTNDHPPTDAQQ
jgi:hypothetical protein